MLRSVSEADGPQFPCRCRLPVESRRRLPDAEQELSSADPVRFGRGETFAAVPS